MPIRHCQKCGLKVLIDESQTTANPFYCQRCAATSKAAGGGGGEPRRVDPLPMVSKRESPPAPSPAAVSAPAAVAAKSGPIKVLCPYCKASFSGRLPSKPAKGACPVCQKELVLLPDGKIRPAATFDLAKWQKEQEMQKMGGDPGVAEQARAVHRALERVGRDESEPEPEPLAAPEPLIAPPSEDPTPAPVVVEQTVPLPPPEPEPVAEASIIPPPRPTNDAMGGLDAHTMLDMGRPSDLDDLVKAAAPRKTETRQRETEDQLAVLGNEPPMRSAAPDPPPEPPPEEAIPTVRQPAEEPEVSGAPVPIPMPSRRSPPPEGKGEPAGAGAAPRRGSGKLIFGVILVLVPLIAGGVGLFMREHKEINNVLAKISAIAGPGLRKLHDKLGELSKPPPKRTQKQPKSDATDDAKARKEMQSELQDLALKIKAMEVTIQKASAADASDEMKAALEDNKSKLDKWRKMYEELQAAYRGKYNEEFKPTD